MAIRTIYRRMMLQPQHLTVVPITSPLMCHSRLLATVANQKIHAPPIVTVERIRRGVDGHGFVFLGQ